ELQAERKVRVRGGQTVDVDLRTPEQPSERSFTLEKVAPVVIEQGESSKLTVRIRRQDFSGAGEADLQDGVLLPPVFRNDDPRRGGECGGRGNGGEGNGGGNLDGLGLGHGGQPERFRRDSGHGEQGTCAESAWHTSRREVVTREQKGDCL